MSDWFDQPGQERGLRFECTMCGNCCTGPPGYVLLSDEEAGALAQRLGLDDDEFLERYTHHTPKGRSLTEHRTSFGYDCVFLDRESVPGKAVCGVYEDRPSQCRTWPFWKSNLVSEDAWRAAARTCPGIGRGRLYSPEHIRITRDRDEG